MNDPTAAHHGNLDLDRLLRHEEPFEGDAGFAD